MAACVLASCLPSLTAAADILIESHERQRPSDASATLAPFVAELKASGVTVDASEVVAAAGDQLPLPGASELALSAPTLDGSFLVTLGEQVELGTKQVLRGDYAAGLTTLEDALARVRANPALVVADASSTAWLTKTYAAIAFAHLRSQRVDAATEAITEQIRSFPEDPIGRIVGPQVATLADEVRKRLDISPPGTLRITVSQPDVQIFVDERARGAGHVQRTAIPGTYRVLVTHQGVSRRYVARVASEKVTELAIDWDVDAAFTMTADAVGFVGQRSGAERVAAATTRYARAGRQHDMIVVSFIERAGRRYLAGAIFEKKTGAVPRHKVIALEPGDGACQRALAQHLLRGIDSPCLLEAVVVTLASPAGRGPELRGSRTLPAVVVTAGLLGLAAGGVMIAIDEAETGKKPTYRDTGPPGIGIAIVGAVVAGIGGYWFYRAGKRASAPVAAITGDMAYVGWAGQF